MSPKTLFHSLVLERRNFSLISGAVKLPQTPQNASSPDYIYWHSSYPRAFLLLCGRFLHCPWLLSVATRFDFRQPGIRERKARGLRRCRKELGKLFNSARASLESVSTACRRRTSERRPTLWRTARTAESARSHQSTISLSIVRFFSFAVAAVAGCDKPIRRCQQCSTLGRTVPKLSTKRSRRCSRPSDPPYCRSDHSAHRSHVSMFISPTLRAVT